MSDTSDTGTRPTDSTGDTGETGDTGAEPSGGTVEAGPAEEVILEVDGREIDVTADPNDAFPTGSQVPDQSASTGSGTTGRPHVVSGGVIGKATVQNRPHPQPVAGHRSPDGPRRIGRESSGLRAAEAPTDPQCAESYRDSRR